jgi:hypothetical protein
MKRILEGKLVRIKSTNYFQGLHEELSHGAGGEIQVLNNLPGLYCLIKCCKKFL